MGPEGLEPGRCMMKVVNRGEGGQLKILRRILAAEVNLIIEILKDLCKMSLSRIPRFVVCFDLLNIGL